MGSSPWVTLVEGGATTGPCHLTPPKGSGTSVELAEDVLLPPEAAGLWLSHSARGTGPQSQPHLGPSASERLELRVRGTCLRE